MTHQGQAQQCSLFFNYDFPKYGKSLAERCPAQGNGRACKLLDTTRAKMTPYMKELEKLVGFSGSRHTGYNISEDNLYEEVEETIYKENQ